MLRLAEAPAFLDWLDEVNIGSGPVTAERPLTGGTQNILIIFRRGDQDYVLRRPPEFLRANSNETMRREARVLAALNGTPVPHPRLVAACDDLSVLGVCFYVMEAVDGCNITEGLPPLFAASPSMCHRMGLALVEGAAAVGAVDFMAAGLETLGRSENYLQRQVERWESQFRSYEEHEAWTGAADLPHVQTVARWLEDRRPATFTPGLMHGDYHLANILFRHDAPELAAIVDWELATIGDPLIDLGWLIALWPERPELARVQPWRGFPTKGELIEHYGRHSRRDMSSIEWYSVFACYKLGILLEGTYARSCAGKAPKDVGKDLHERTIALFDRAMGWIS